MPIDGQKSGGTGGAAGTVIGPSGATDGDIALFDGTTGHLIKDSGAKISTDGTLSANSDHNIPTEKAVKTAITSAITGLYNDRGNYDASGNAYPSSGGSGTAGAILKGDIWTISVGGILPTLQTVVIGDTVRALINTPGNIQANWAISQTNIGYVPENSANKVTAFSTPTDVQYPSAKLVSDQLALKENSIAAGTTSQYYRGDKTFQSLDKTAVGLGNVDNTSDVNKPVSTAQAAAIAVKWNSLVPTPVKTSAYVAAPADLVVVDASAASVPITLPTSPADKTVIAIKQIAISGSFTTTINTGGSDVFNKTGGATSGTLTLLNQAMILQYKASGGIWYILADDLSLGQLDIRYQSGFNVGAIASGTDTYTVTLTPVLTTYTAFNAFSIQFTNANTTVATLNVNGLGAKSIKKAGGLALAAGDIVAGTIYKCTYDGTNFQIDIGVIGAYADYVPTFTGFSANPGITSARYTLNGKMCHVYCKLTTGTSNSTTKTMTLPFAAANTGIQYAHGIIVMNAGVVSTSILGVGETRVNSSIMDIYKDNGHGAWTNTGNCFWTMNFVFEIA